MSNRISSEFKLDTRDAARRLTEIEKASTDAGEALEDVGTKGRVMADVLGQAADAAQADLADAKRMAELLGNALGPELTAKLNADGKLLNIVDDLRKVGLTADDVEADIDQLASSIRRLDDSAESIRSFEGEMGRVRNAQDRVTEGANMNRSVIANFAGNAAQELPMVTGAFGPLGMAIGQTVEYATEGNIAIGKMVTAGLAMGGVALVIERVTSSLANQKRRAEETAQRLEEWVDKIREGKDSVEELVAAAREAGKINVNVLGMFGEEDITENLARLGMTADQFFRLVKGGGPEIERWAREMEAAGISGSDFNTVVLAATQLTGEYAEATGRAAIQAKVFADNTAEVSPAADMVAASIEAAKEQVNRFGEDGVENMGDVEDATDDAQTSVRRIRDELAGLRADIENDNSALDLASQFDDLKASAIDAFGAAASGADDAEEKQRDHQRAVNDTKLAVADYAEKVLGLPPERVTQIVAMIDQGEADRVEALLNTIARNRFARITPGTGAPARSADGNYNTPAGANVINDGLGGELVELPGGSKVMTAANTKNYMRQAGGEDAQPVVVHLHRHYNRIVAVGSPGQVAGALSRRVRGRS